MTFALIIVFSCLFWFDSVLTKIVSKTELKSLLSADSDGVMICLLSLVRTNDCHSMCHDAQEAHRRGWCGCSERSFVYSLVKLRDETDELGLWRQPGRL